MDVRNCDVSVTNHVSEETAMERDAASGGRRALVCQGAEEQGVLASLASVPRGSPVTEMAAVGNRVHISGCFLVAAFLVG